jgi:ParB family chromosome partitioning protein
MADHTNKGLGRGFEALLPPDFDKSMLLSKEDRIEKIPITLLEVNPYQPRHNFDPESLQSLAQSIKQFGIVQPLIVSPNKNKFYVIAGERRWRAAILAGLTHVPAISKKREDLEKLEIAIIENVQRVDLNPLEQAFSIQKLHDQFNLKFEDIALKLGKAHTTVVNTYRLINLPDFAKEALVKEKITEGHARQILAISSKDQQRYLLGQIIKNNWTVRKAEQFVIGLKANTGKLTAADEHTAVENKQTKILSQKLNTKVTLRRTAHGGKIEINFKNDQDLERIVNFFS